MLLCFVIHFQFLVICCKCSACENMDVECYMLLSSFTLFRFSSTECIAIILFLLVTYQTWFECSAIVRGATYLSLVYDMFPLKKNICGYVKHVSFTSDIFHCNVISFFLFFFSIRDSKWVFNLLFLINWSMTLSWSS